MVRLASQRSRLFRMCFVHCLCFCDLTLALFIRADEVMKGAAHLSEAFLDPKLSLSVEPNETPWNTAFGTDKGLFEWYNQKENVARSQRFGIALAGTTKMEPATAILTG